MYCALIGDIVGSKLLEDRWSVQEKLKEVLEKVNKKFQGDIASKFTITLGDEFQGLLLTTKEVMVLIDYIRLSMHPVKIRFGIGVGPMSTEINQKAAIGADGPAYYAARAGLTSVKDLNGKYVQAYGDARCYRFDQTLGQSIDLAFLNALLSTTGFIADKWTDKQRMIIFEIEEGDLSQRDIGKKLAITQSSVQRRLDSAGYYTYKNGRDVANGYLNDLWEVMNG